MVTHFFWVGNAPGGLRERETCALQPAGLSLALSLERRDSLQHLRCRKQSLQKSARWYASYTVCLPSEVSHIYLHFSLLVGKLEPRFHWGKEKECIKSQVYARSFLCFDSVLTTTLGDKHYDTFTNQIKP